VCAQDRTPALVEIYGDPATGALHARPLFRRYWLVGAAAVRPLGSYVLRAEALHATYTEGPWPLVRNGVRGAAGLERRVAHGRSTRYTGIVQYAIDTTTSERLLQLGTYLSSPYRVYRHAVTASAAASWHQQYEVELRAMRELNQGSTIVSAKFTYRRNDRLAVWLAADALAGPEDTPIGRLDAADRILGGIIVYP
jgi:hypothetical protein